MKKHILLSLMLLSIVGYAQRATRKQSNKAQAELNNMKDSDSDVDQTKNYLQNNEAVFTPLTFQKK